MNTCLLSLFAIFMVASGQEQQYDPFDYDVGIKDVVDNRYGQCPIPRICRSNCFQGNTLIDCVRVRAGPYVPSFKYYAISGRLWQINMSYNELEYLDETSFITGDAVPINITVLDLKFNLIQSIGPNTFNGTIGKDMTYLDLSYNQLETIPLEALTGLSSLETLLLSNNRLVSVNSFCTAQLPALTSLDLSNNQLSWIQDDCFRNAGLQSGNLNLVANKISAINTCAYRQVKLGSHMLEGNPLICGCSDKFQGLACTDISEASSRESTQKNCEQPSCRNLMLNTTYKALSQSNFDLDLTWSADGYHDSFSVVLVQIRNDSFSQIASDDITSGSLKFNATGLDFSNNYTVCVAISPSQRQCQYLNPPRYVRSTSPSFIASSLLLIVSLIFLR